VTKKEIDATLARRFDALNQAIALAEARLKAMRPPHDVWVSYRYEGWRTFSIGLAKVDGRWRLAHETRHDKGGEEVKPLVEMPVAVRVEAVSGGSLRVLQTRIVEAKEEFTPEVEAAIRAVEEFLNEVTR